MARCFYEDESGVELWIAANGEGVPPGTLITGPDGQRYLAVQSAEDPDESTQTPVRITLRRLN